MDPLIEALALASRIRDRHHELGETIDQLWSLLAAATDDHTSRQLEASLYHSTVQSLRSVKERL